MTHIIAGGFAYAGALVSGMSVIAITDNDPAAARNIAREIADLAWELREDMRIDNVPPERAVADAIAHPENPVVLVDVGDNIGGGTPGTALSCSPSCCARAPTTQWLSSPIPRQ